MRTREVRVREGEKDLAKLARAVQSEATLSSQWADPRTSPGILVTEVSSIVNNSVIYRPG